ncbi:NACHT, LRR and PYD domains-containing protein 14 isoform X4 [Panthera leo]|uniref:NACHT, LRR and PYD domains-containing protein 14 isoform X4 n=1 Tax=Panthera leo TaxID=9689 RepID=UPI001C6A740E|nr:NACHT, LRR and PYD domains-containing protein 14 isoform X4 [Panthera leo]
MTDGSSSSFFPDFGLLLYLEELNKEELNKFKLLLKNETMESRCCQIPWAEVKKAKREDLANLMNKYYPGEQAWDVALKIFGKMNLKDLYERARAEINWTAHSLGPEDARTQEEQDEQEAVQGDGTEYRTQITEKYCITWDKKCLFGEPEDLHPGVAQKDQELLEHLFDVDVKTGEQPQTVVLQGPAGVGKTTLVRKAVVDWAQGNLYQQRFSYVFYLNAREINQLRERSFVQMISKDWPSTEGPIERIMSQPGSLLFIIDSFDELNFAFEEPESVLCEDWTQVHPVSFLLSSLLRKVMLPESSLLVTTRLTACKKLKPLLKNPHSVELLGMSKGAREEYIYQCFEDRKRALQVFNSLRSNEMAFSMCKVPLVCWLLCTCLEQQIEKGGDIMLTCKTTTALFICYISSLFPPVDGNSASLPSQTQISSLCHLAAKGVWTMTSVFYRENLRKHGLSKSDVSIFLDLNILQKDMEYENCYMFTHLHVQEFLAAMFYMLQDSWGTKNSSFQSFEDLKLLLESNSYKDPHLTQMKCFLFGLLNEDRVKQLEKTFSCKMSLEIKWKILQWLEMMGNSEDFPAQVEFLELFFYLYETQDEAYISQAMSYFQKIVINICGKIHLLVSSFCLKHCQCLRTMKLSVTMVFEKMLNSSPLAEIWRRDGGHITHCWQDLCSVLHTNEHLRELDLCHSNLNELAMKTFYQELRHPSCKLQKLLMRFLSFPDGCRDIASSLTHNQNLMHLDLKGSDVGDNGVKSLCEALKNPECKLQNLRLRRCHFTSLSGQHLSSSLLRNKSLTHLDLGSNWLQDDGVKLLCDVFRHPSCNLQDLGLMGCALTSMCCLDLASAILNNPHLQSLDLGNNDLQDDGVKILYEALRHPNCNIQRLGLEYCGLTSLCCQDLSCTLRSNQNLIKINLTQNTLGYEGIMKLCEVLRSPECKLKVLGVCKEAFDEEAQKLLEAVRVSNPQLIIERDCNDHSDEDVSWWRCP